jgi:hypothetical protein
VIREGIHIPDFRVGETVRPPQRSPEGRAAFLAERVRDQRYCRWVVAWLHFERVVEVISETDLIRLEMASDFRSYLVTERRSLSVLGRNVKVIVSGAGHNKLHCPSAHTRIHCRNEWVERTEILICLSDGGPAKKRNEGRANQNSQEACPT